MKVTLAALSAVFGLYFSTGAQALTCQEASDNYGIIADITFGSAPADVKGFWRTQNCRTSPGGKYSCQAAADIYGIVPDVTFGFATDEVKTNWERLGCFAFPYGLPRCEAISKVFHVIPNRS